MEAQSEAQSIKFLLECSRRGQHFGVPRTMRVEQRDNAYFRSLSPKLAGHLVGHESAEGRTTNIVRSIRLQFANFTDIVGGHLFNCKILATAFAIKSNRLDAIERLVGMKMARHI